MQGQIEFYKEREQGLLEKVKENKHEAFGEIYKYLLDDVYRYAYGILNNKQKAEDVVSTAFIEFYKKIDQFEWQNISMKFWLFRTVRNLSYKNFRKEKRAKETQMNEVLENELHEEISFVDDIVNKDLIKDVKQEIAKLNDLEKETITLRIWEDMQFNEIANLQNINESTCRWRFYNSINKIKKSLKDRGVYAVLPLPNLFTSIKEIGKDEGYKASINLKQAVMNGELINYNDMSTMKTVLTSKVTYLFAAGFIFFVAAGGLGYTVLQANDKDIDLNEEDIQLIGNKTENEFFPDNVNGQTPTNVLDSDEYKIIQQPINNYNSQSSDEKATVEQTFQTTYKTDDSKKLDIVYSLFTSRDEAATMAKLNDEAFSNLTSDLENFELKTSDNVQTWGAHKNVPEDKATEINSGEVRVVIEELAIMIRVFAGGGYDEREFRDAVSEYFNLITDENTNYITKDKILTLDKLPKKYLEDFEGITEDYFKDFNDKAKDLLDNFGSESPFNNDDGSDNKGESGDPEGGDIDSGDNGDVFDNVDNPFNGDNSTDFEEKFKDQQKELLDEYDKKLEQLESESGV